jgi:hypothetical protein
MRLLVLILRSAGARCVPSKTGVRVAQPWKHWRAPCTASQHEGACSVDGPIHAAADDRAAAARVPAPA